MARRAGQRGHIEKHRDKYRAIVSAGTDPLTGKRRFLKKTCDTEKQAQVELAKLLNLDPPIGWADGCRRGFEGSSG
jgi:hypothetical protein